MKQDEGEQDNYVPSFSLPRVPQSVSRGDSVQNKNPLFQSIQATPTRNPSRPGKQFTEIGKHSDFPPSSPLHVRRSSAQLFSSVPDSAAKPSSIAWASQLQETPVKRASVNINHIETTLISSCDKENTHSVEENSGRERPRQTSKIQQEDSIYKSLGWDDPDDLDDLT
jgi:DNA replication regulator SLD3